MTTVQKNKVRFYDTKRTQMKRSFAMAQDDMKLRREEQDDPYASKEYVWPNQVKDAAAIFQMIIMLSVVFVAVIKQPKLGCNGLMFELARLVCTHNDDDKYIPPENVYILTGMSNTEWVETIQKDCPQILRKNVYHRPKIGGKGKGALKIDDLKGKKNLLLIIDEVDVATKAIKNKKQTIHAALEAAGILDMDYMVKNNVRVVAISATICKEMRAMNKFGKQYAQTYSMTVPREYVGVETMNDMKILKPSPKITSESQMVKFIKGAINYFGEMDPRVHIIRGTKKTRDFVLGACQKMNVQMYDHEHHSKLSHKELLDIFKCTKHVVIFVKNMFGRADFIPNEMKMKIGMWVDKYVTEKSRNANVQLQAGIGRLSGFYRSLIEAGHKMGYIFTNLQSVAEYIDFYRNPSFARVKCHKSQPVLQPKHVENSDKYVPKIETRALPATRGENSFRVYQHDANNDIVRAEQIMGYSGKAIERFKTIEDGEWEGFTKTKCEGFGTGVHSVRTVIKSILAGKGRLKQASGKYTWRSKYPCYLDLSNPNSLVWVLLVQPGDENKLKELDYKLPDHMNDWNIQCVD